ncbi:MAG: hypothetical protein IH870_03710 [Chloroflexi bacterium]|nr:hypothetical protein [Chloroflexota bacterium]
MSEAPKAAEEAGQVASTGNHLLLALGALYSVLMGLAVVTAIQFLFGNNPEVIPTPRKVPAESYFMFFALLLTIIPFYHGTLTHIAKTHGTGGGKSFQLLLDLILVLFQGAIFSAMGFALGQVQVFIIWFIFLLGLSPIFVVLTRLLAKPKSAAKTPWKKAKDYPRKFFEKKINDQEMPPNIWTLANVLAILFLLLGVCWLPPAFVKEGGALAVLGIAAARTLADYVFARKYYFPRINASGEESPSAPAATAGPS